MLRFVIRDYFWGLKSGRIRSWNVVYWAVYILLALPALTGFYDSALEVGIYLAALLPVAWMMYASAACPPVLPKRMFLCPMDREMRRSYIRAAYRFRVCFHAALGAVGAVVSGFLENDWGGVLALFVNGLLLSVICPHMVFIDSGGDKWSFPGWGRGAVQGIGVILGILLQVILVSVAETGGWFGQKRWEQVLIVCVMAVFALFAAKYLTYWKPMQEEAVCYEQASRYAVGAGKNWEED